MGFELTNVMTFALVVLQQTALSPGELGRWFLEQHVFLYALADFLSLSLRLDS